MTCDELRQQVAAFHFGELSLATRDEVELHLGGCLSCVREVVAFKRAVELSEEGPRPSEAARRSLRAAVATELGLSWRWWERPVAFFMAASSVAAAITIVQVLR